MDSLSVSMHAGSTTTAAEYLRWNTPLSNEHSQALSRFRDPTTWPTSSKVIVYGMSVLTTLMAAYSISAYVAGVDSMAAEFQSESIVVLIGMPSFQTGFAIGPMVLAPLSEIHGRKPVFLGTYALFNGVCTLIIALIDNLPALLVVRFFQGIGASTFSTMVGGVVADLFDPRSRGFPMSVFATASFSGGLGQLVSGFIVPVGGWRWIYWHQLIINGCLMLVIALLFKETRGPVLLSRKARALNKLLEHERLPESPPDPFLTSEEKIRTVKVRWKVEEDEKRASIRHMIKSSLTLPFYLLFTEPVVFLFSVWISFSWALMFLFFESIPLMFQTSYGFTPQQSGLVLIAMCLGALSGNLFYPVQEHLYRRYAHQVPQIKLLHRLRTRNGKSPNIEYNPEARLYSACILSISMSIGMFMYGATSFSSVPWIFPAVAVTVVTFGAYAIYLSVFTYFADVYTTYASSAMAAQSFCRNVLAGALPLVVNIMFQRLTFLGASSLLGGIALLLSAVPCILVLYGPRIRARSPIAKTLA